MSNEEHNNRRICWIAAAARNAVAGPFVAVNGPQAAGNKSTTSAPTIASSAIVPIRDISITPSFWNHQNSTALDRVRFGKEIAWRKGHFQPESAH